MFELMLWRARVGLFNGIKCKRPRNKHLFCKSDITPSVIAIYNSNKLLLQLHHPVLYSSHTPYLNTSFLYLLLLLPYLLGLLITYKIHTHKPKLPTIPKLISTYLYVYLPILLLISGDIRPNPGPVNKNFSLCHLNAMSLTANERIDDINDVLVDTHAFDAIAVTETHLDNSVSDYKVELHSYNFYRLDRNRNVGGVTIYCRDHISSKRPRIT